MTLVEVITAMAMSALVVALALALFRDVGTATRLFGKRGQGETESHAVFAALCNNVLAGRGIISLTSQSLTLLNVAGRKVEYRWEDSTLTVNGRAYAMKLAGLEIAPKGPPLPKDDYSARFASESMDLDSLDEDKDGAIDFGELDRDGDEELEIEELRFLATVTLRLTTIANGIPSRRSATLHVRNHAGRDSEALAEQAMDTGETGW